MNEQIERQLVRQLKILNFWVTTLGVLLLIALSVIGYFLFQTAMFIKHTNDNIQSFRTSTTERLDVKRQACDGNDAFAQFLHKSGACN